MPDFEWKEVEEKACFEYEWAEKQINLTRFDGEYIMAFLLYEATTGWIAIIEGRETVLLAETEEEAKNAVLDELETIYEDKIADDKLMLNDIREFNKGA